MKNTKTFKVVMLPTEKANNHLFSNKDNPGHLYYSGKRLEDKNYDHYNLYIISDDAVNPGEGIIHWETVNAEHTGIGKAEISEFPYANNKGIYNSKIVATTDKSLEYKVNCPIYDDSRGYKLFILPQISESFIQAYIKAYNEGKPITEVDLEMERIGEHWVHEKTGEKNFDEKPPLGHTWIRFWNDSIIKTRSDNTVIVRQSKMYSREQVEVVLKNFLQFLTKRHDIKQPLGGVGTWIEENL